MSGGHFRYKDRNFQWDVIEALPDDEQVRDYFPKTASVLAIAGSAVTTALHSIDLDLSGDSDISDEKALAALHLRLTEALEAADKALKAC